MMTKLVKWGSNDGQIIKSWLSGRRKADFLSSVVDLSYDWLRIEGHLGNVDYIIVRWYEQVCDIS